MEELRIAAILVGGSLILFTAIYGMLVFIWWKRNIPKGMTFNEIAEACEAADAIEQLRREFYGE